LWLTLAVASVLTAGVHAGRFNQASVLDSHLLVTWYGNPHTSKMGILGEQTGAARANALRTQAAAYRPLTAKAVLMAYHLVAVVAQPTAGIDGKWRRRESPAVIRALLDEARTNGFKLILDIQPGRSTVAEEVAALRSFLSEPEVYLALDPEFAMSSSEQPGREVGQLFAKDVNTAVKMLDELIVERNLPPKVLIVHQFRLDMLPDKRNVQAGPRVDVVLNMDGFGSQALKRSSYRAVMQQGPLEFAGIKLFYRQDTVPFTPAQVMGLVPLPSVVVYQ
jgi:hypothetical protein